MTAYNDSETTTSVLPEDKFLTQKSAKSSYHRHNPVQWNDIALPVKYSEINDIYLEVDQKNL